MMMRGREMIVNDTIFSEAQRYLHLWFSSLRMQRQYVLCERVSSLAHVIAVRTFKWHSIGIFCTLIANVAL